MQPEQNAIPVSSKANDPIIGPLIPKYLADLGAKASALRDALNAEDWDELYELAHAIKGNAGMYGFNELSQAAKAYGDSYHIDAPDCAARAIEFTDMCERHAA